MKNNLLHAFSERSFVYLWLGEVFTQISMNLFNFFIILVVFSLTKSNVAVSIVIICFTFPSILFGILAGVYVDRWDKKRVLIITNISRAVLLIILALSHTNILIIYIITFLVSFITQFFIPAETPMIPLVVPRPLLLSANALFGMGIYGSILVAYVLAGPMLLFLGQVNTLFTLSALMLLGGGAISLIKYRNSDIPHTPQPQTELAIKREIQSALAMMMKSKRIYQSLFLLAVSQILILIIATVTPGYADKVLHMAIEKFPLFFVTPAAFGMVFGAIMLVNFFQDAKKEKIITLGLFLSGIAMLLLPFATILASKEVVSTINHILPQFLNITNLHIILVLGFFLGVSNALIFVPCNTIIQEETTDEQRGKIYGVLNALVGLFSLAPIILVGTLSDTLGVGYVIFGIGTVLLFLTGVRVVVD